jgi:hypothetical protein
LYGVANKPAATAGGDLRGFNKGGGGDFAAAAGGGGVNDKPAKSSIRSADTDKLLGDIRHLIETARSTVAATVNAGMIMLY